MHPIEALESCSANLIPMVPITLCLSIAGSYCHARKNTQLLKRSASQSVMQLMLFGYICWDARLPYRPTILHSTSGSIDLRTIMHALHAGASLHNHLICKSPTTTEMLMGTWMAFREPFRTLHRHLCHKRRRGSVRETLIPLIPLPVLTWTVLVHVV